MEKEIEIKLTYEDKEEVKSKLIEMGLVEGKTVNLEDRYYSQKGNSMENTNDLVRIRKEEDQIEFTFKGKCKDENNIWTRNETSVKIGDMDAMHNILLMLGFKIIKENASERNYWEKDNIQIIFIKYSKPTILEMMEIESNDKKKIENMLNRLKGKVKEAGEELFNVFDKKRDS